MRVAPLLDSRTKCPATRRPRFRASPRICAIHALHERPSKAGRGLTVPSSGRPSPTRCISAPHRPRSRAEFTCTPQSQRRFTPLPEFVPRDALYKQWPDGTNSLRCEVVPSSRQPARVATRRAHVSRAPLSATSSPCGWKPTASRSGQACVAFVPRTRSCHCFPAVLTNPRHPGVRPSALRRRARWLPGVRNR